MLMICGLIVVVLAVIVVVYLYLVNSSNSNKTTRAGEAKTPEAAVQGYLQAVSSSDAVTALSFMTDQKVNRTFLTDAMLKASNAINPITDITVTKDSSSTKQTATVTATYQIGDQKAQADFTATLNGKYYFIDKPAQTVDFTSVYVRGVGMTLDGRSLDDAPSPVVDLFPGTYQVAVSNSMLSVPDNKFFVTDPYSTTTVPDLPVTLKDSARQQFASLAQTTLDGCVAELNISTSCRFGFGRLGENVDPVAGSVKWTYTTGNANFSPTDFQYDPTSNPTRVDLTPNIQLHMIADGSDGMRYTGDQNITGVHIDFTDPTKLVITFDSSTPTR